jgi:hypothetical protein
MTRHNFLAQSKFLTLARAVENVTGLVAGDPFPVRSGRFGAWYQRARRMVHFILGAEGLQVAAHVLVAFTSQVVIGRGDNRVFWARNLAFGYDPDALLRVRIFIYPALLLADLNTARISFFTRCSTAPIALGTPL